VRSSSRATAAPSEPTRSRKVGQIQFSSGVDTPHYKGTSRPDLLMAPLGGGRATVPVAELPRWPGDGQPFPGGHVATAPPSGRAAHYEYVEPRYHHALGVHPCTSRRSPCSNSEHRRTPLEATTKATTEIN